ncbi:MAG: DUF4261 domain-containing protein [Deltaproteobacteria bacterium]|nr:DUF4261 domain-containing protein [Deltaproteobacteria bacterium]
MPKGHFTQSTTVLFEHAPSLDVLAAALGGFTIARRMEDPGPPWMGGPSLLIPMRPEVNGYVLIDIVPQPWPDRMGDPKQHVDLFGAWALGWFGPFVYPGNLMRAKAMSFGWRGAKEVAERHTSFVRIKASYVLGASNQAQVLPADYAPLPELQLVTELARAVMKAPHALAYFNPNGEVLRSPEGLDEDLTWCREHDLPPLPVWANVRMFAIDELPGWSLMDTVGMEQLDVQDHEACFQTGKYKPQEVDKFLRNSTLYVLNEGRTINDGDTMDGPGGIPWQAFAFEESLTPRNRPTLRWLPLDGTRAPPPVGPK